MPEEEGWWREHSRRGTDYIINIAKENWGPDKRIYPDI